MPPGPSRMFTPDTAVEIGKSAWVTSRAQPPLWMRLWALLKEAQNCGMSPTSVGGGLTALGNCDCSFGFCGPRIAESARGAVDGAFRRLVGIAKGGGMRRTGCKHRAAGGCGREHVASRKESPGHGPERDGFVRGGSGQFAHCDSLLESSIQGEEHVPDIRRWPRARAPRANVEDVVKEGIRA